MNDRRTRRYKEKRPLFPFGQLMLPIVGVVALGILILGIRLFFLPSHSSVSSERIVPATPSVPSLPAEQEEPVAFSETPATLTTAVVAVPVSAGEASLSSPKAALPAPQQQQGQPKTQPKPQPTTTVAKPAQSPPVSPLSSPPSASSAPKGGWGVQVGAFTAPSAAESLAAKLRSSGESVVVVKASVGGKLYYRVRVVAGATRQEAEKKSVTLKAQGYPTLVVSL